MPWVLSLVLVEVWAKVAAQLLASSPINQSGRLQASLECGCCGLAADEFETILQLTPVANVGCE